MASIKEYNKKLKSLKNTRKITKTMKMVAASKLHKAHQAQANAKLYARNLTELISRISAVVLPEQHPLLIKRQAVQNALILVFTSDKGLCGAFNHNCHRHVVAWLKENRQNYKKVDLSFCGKRGYFFFRRMENTKTYYENIVGDPKFESAIQIGNALIQSFLKTEYDEVYLAYNQFFSPISQKTVFEKLLPIDPQAMIHEKIEHPREYLFEPQGPELLEFLIPHFVYFKIYFSLLENAAGEHGARMSAMDSATKNATDFIDKTTLLRNRARQAAITTELTEIVAGAEALR